VLVCLVLGPVEVEAGGAHLDVGGPLPRRLLTALVAADGRAVPDDRLVEIVWGEDAPPRAVAALQVYVSRLRRALGPQGQGLVERSGSGYRIALEPDATDAARFTKAVADGKQLLAESAAKQAFQVLTDALELWRGEAYADLHDSPALEAARGRLGELREVAVEERLAAQLAMGDAASAVAELEAGVRVEPYRERRWALLTLGLYRCGRQGDALSALRRVRGLLADDLGVDPGVELQELEGRVLAQDPRLLLPAPGALTTGIGRRLSSFIGRDGEVATVARLLAEQRLVTIVGPAGVGKTRLAFEYVAGAEMSWLVRLSDVRQPEVLAHAVADAAGLAEIAGDPRLALIRALGPRRGLLVLDNCEHLVDAVAELAIEMLESCPHLRILATSRVPLDIDGETIVSLDPLPLKADDGSDGAGVLLLLDRVRAIRPGWTPTPEAREQARQVCAALDGLPLALELAAARARVLGLGEIAERLDDRFAVLGSVPRGSLTPHTTLQAAISWSVDLLSDEDRALLLRLWPFEGGFSLEAAEAVQPKTVDASLLESLSSLVARSMIMADTTMTPTRYRLMETIRAYCREIDPDAVASQEAHARWIREFVARWAIDSVSERSAWSNRVLTRELPNLRAGIGYDLTHRPDLALHTVAKLNWFWARGGHIAEGRRQLGAALLAAPAAPTLDRARAWVAMTSLAYYAGDLEDAKRCGDETYAVLGEPVDHEHHVLYGRALYYTALGGLLSGDVEAAREAAELSIAVGKELAEDWLVVGGQMALGGSYVLGGQPAPGEENLAAAAELAQRCGYLWAAGWSELGIAQSMMRSAAVSAGSIGDALAALRRALAWFREDEDVSYTLAVLRAGAVALMLTDDPLRGFTLRGAVSHHAERLGLWPDSIVGVGLGPVEAALDPTFDPAERAAAERQGYRLSWTAMVELLVAASASEK
jgi:predicted ATPase/DNA-binding SARP family transcriptional activator